VGREVRGGTERWRGQPRGALFSNAAGHTSRGEPPTCVDPGAHIPVHEEHLSDRRERPRVDAAREVAHLTGGAAAEGGGRARRRGWGVQTTERASRQWGRWQGCKAARSGPAATGQPGGDGPARLGANRQDRSTPLSHPLRQAGARANVLGPTFAKRGLSMTQGVSGSKRSRSPPSLSLPDASSPAPRRRGELAARSPGASGNGRTR
jgi:hypothetical protein